MTLMEPTIEKGGSSFKPQKQFPIVAIGASAGGLEAMIEFLSSLPADTNLAYVYIQHLDRDFKSQLTEILQRHTEMVVLEATDLLPIKPNHLYVIQPDKDLSIIDGVIKVNQRPPKGTLHLPIDQFFNSLAEKRKEGAIGIILSGSASDGAIGMKAIKMAGGFTFVQDETAKYRSMPSAAIAEGVVDAILSPKEIAKEIARLSQKTELLQQLFTNDVIEEPDTESQQANKTPAKEENLDVILSQLRIAAGVDFTHYKDKTIRRRILRRMLLYKLETLKEYTDYIKKHPKEIDALYADLLINVTHFFRDQEATEYISKEILPKVLKGKEQKEGVRIWIPACSTGEEVYSLAMLFTELLPENSEVRVNIFATDLSERVIAKARTGIYTSAEVANISEKRLSRFFTKVDGHYRISKALREMCVFAPHNIFKDPPFSKIDIISCCNLLIYLDNVLQKVILSNFHYSLNRSGYLILGKSETVGSSASLYTQLDKNFKIFQKRNDVAPGVVFNTSFHLPMVEPAAVPKIPKITSSLPPDNSTLQKVVDETFLTRYTLPGVVINSSMEILQFRGSTGSFLEHLHGSASLNLLKMSKPGLSFELKSAVSKVIKTGIAFKKTGVSFESNGALKLADFEVAPLKMNNSEPLFTIVFEEQKTTTSAEAAGASGNKREKQLEAELAALRNDMRGVVEEQEAAYEELQAANEEILSSNEELRSINEELETSKEEIEAGNEELLTINYELNTRNNQLAELYEYNQSIFTTIRESLVILDKNLRVKSANKAFYETFKVSAADTEARLVYEIGNRQWDIPELKSLLENIIPEQQQFEDFIVEHQFEQIGKKVMVLNARRVVRKVHLDEVILLAIEDITEHKQAERLLQEREGWLRNMANNVPVMLWEADTDKKFTFLNNTWLDYTGQSLENQQGPGWMEGVHPEDLSNVLNIFNEGYNSRQPFKVEYRMKRFDNEYRWVINSGVPSLIEGEFTGFIGSCIEIHDERKLNLELEEKIQERTKELQHLNQELEQSNNELQQFAFIASHDLQEPLRKVTTFISRIKDVLGNQPPEKVAGLLSKTTAATERMRRLIDDVLNYSKMSRLSGGFIPTDLNPVIASVIADLELLIQEKNAAISIAELPVINAIPFQISQLFYNLLQNALKFSNPDAPVLISINAHPFSMNDEVGLKLKEGVNYHVITIKDNGIGFSQEFSEQVFEIFQRLNNEINYEGTGIGLALCRRIVNNHGGIITAKSEEGQGAEFKIILPTSSTKG